MLTPSFFSRARAKPRKSTESKSNWSRKLLAGSRCPASTSGAISCSTYGIPVIATRTARTPEEAAALAAEVGGAVALKILSPDITHKTDVGGVALDVAGPSVVRETAAAMLDRVAKARPGARISGFTVAPTVRRPGAYELIVGVIEDPQFGPVILFGHGGTAVEVVNDKALALPPLNMHLAYEVMSRTRIYRQLSGYRGLPPANLDAVALTLIRVSHLVVDVAEIAELDINPLLADEYGVVALDARIRVAKACLRRVDPLSQTPGIAVGGQADRLVSVRIVEGSPAMEGACRLAIDVSDGV